MNLQVTLHFALAVALQFTLDTTIVEGENC